MIDDACTEIRKIAHEMMPHALEKLGLINALKDLVDKIIKNANSNGLAMHCLRLPGQSEYMAALNRYPTSEEQAAVEEFLTQYPSEKECFEDLLWALINSKDFLFVH